MKSSFIFLTPFLFLALALAAPGQNGDYRYSQNRPGKKTSTKTSSSTRRPTSTATLTVSPTRLSSVSSSASTSAPKTSSSVKPSASASASVTSSATPSASANPNSQIWQPAVGTPFQIVLNSVVDGSVAQIQPAKAKVFDVDMFNTPATTIAQLKAQGKKVICYFSAGTSEDWRPDFAQFQPADLGGPVCMDDSCSKTWPGERWLNIKGTAANPTHLWLLMKARIELAAQKGCDAVDPDNMDAYGNVNGIGLSLDDGVTYFQYLASVAHSLNMGIGLKNALDMIPRVGSIVEFAVNEECQEFSECGTYSSFLNTKPVFHIEYNDSLKSKSKRMAKRATTSVKTACAGDTRMSTVIKKLELDGIVQYCDGTIANTRVIR